MRFHLIQALLLGIGFFFSIASLAEGFTSPSDKDYSFKVVIEELEGKDTGEEFSDSNLVAYFVTPSFSMSHLILWLETSSKTSHIITNLPFQSRDPPECG